MSKYILSIDQSTSGTKASLYDEEGKAIAKSALPHRQIVDENGYVSHDLNEIYKNTIDAAADVIVKSQIDRNNIIAAGISNQRETAATWNRSTGKPLNGAVVWHCSRAKNIVDAIDAPTADIIRNRTGLTVSPYFPAAKYAWLLQNTGNIDELKQSGNLMLGTIDSFLIYRLTGNFFTDYSNASRTQLLNLFTLTWDEEILKYFGVTEDTLPQIQDSDAFFGETDFEGVLNKKIPILSVMGDSHSALYAQDCRRVGDIKATYGTGSSIVMNLAETPIFSKSALSTSIGWKIDGKISYILEGNINYSGAIITWLINDLELIKSADETESLAFLAEPKDKTYIVPAFSGLSAPYNNSSATGVIAGMTRSTKKAEIVKAALDAIAYQAADIIALIGEETKINTTEIKADGGVTKNKYLMQFQSDISGKKIRVSNDDALSSAGVAYLAGKREGLYTDDVFTHVAYKDYTAKMDDGELKKRINGWHDAVKLSYKRY